MLHSVSCFMSLCALDIAQLASQFEDINKNVVLMYYFEAIEM